MLDILRNDWFKHWCGSLRRIAKCFRLLRGSAAEPGVAPQCSLDQVDSVAEAVVMVGVVHRRRARHFAAE